MTTQTFTKKIKENSQTQRFVFRVLISSFGILIVTYFYLISSITFNVLARKSLDTEIKNLGSSIGELELSYLAEVNTIDKTFALSHGFVENQKPIFASRDITAVAIR